MFFLNKMNISPKFFCFKF